MQFAVLDCLFPKYSLRASDFPAGLLSVFRTARIIADGDATGVGNAGELCFTYS